MKNKLPKKTKILAALSGGVDSAVTAALLKKQGYDITGVFVINYDEQNADGTSCWLSDYRDAVRVAAHLEIPIIRWNFVEEYQKYVLDYLYFEYEAGRTPNPDVYCNSYIKFGAWLDRAKKEGYEYLATGHYAKKSFDDSKNTYILEIPVDTDKDQTYFLHQLSQEQLAAALFPLENLSKQEVRKIAEKLELPVASKSESMGICFVGETPIKEFLSNKIAANSGDVVNTSGDKIGTHDGLAYITIGQRHGFSQPGGTEPYYAVKKDIANNTLIVGHADDPALFVSEIEVQDMHWISGQAPEFPLQCTVRFRHRQKRAKASLIEKKGKIIIKTDTPQRAITPGQFAVVYVDNKCLGGGIISKQ